MQFYFKLANTFHIGILYVLLTETIISINPESMHATVPLWLQGLTLGFPLQTLWLPLANEFSAIDEVLLYHGCHYPTRDDMLLAAARTRTRRQ